MFIFYKFLFEMPREALFIMLCYVNILTDLLARKRKERYCDAVRHVRTRIRFAMLRTTLIALRGYRGKKIDI